MLQIEGCMLESSMFEGSMLRSSTRAYNIVIR